MKKEKRGRDTFNELLILTGNWFAMNEGEQKRRGSVVQTTILNSQHQ